MYKYYIYIFIPNDLSISYAIRAGTDAHSGVYCACFGECKTAITSNVTSGNPSTIPLYTYI
jgi:MFS superfamily sulfate permease-like transporter